MSSIGAAYRKLIHRTTSPDRRPESGQHPRRLTLAAIRRWCRANGRRQWPRAAATPNVETLIAPVMCEARFHIYHSFGHAEDSEFRAEIPGKQCVRRDIGYTLLRAHDEGAQLALTFQSLARCLRRMRIGAPTALTYRFDCLPACGKFS